MTTTLAHAHGEPVLSASTRTTPEDFRVEEIDGFEATGSGEHLLLTVEKRGMNTAYAADRIARWAGIPAMGVSYAGMKDRHAVTSQRFSVHLPKRIAPDLATLESAELRVTRSEWHSRKLPRGALSGNRFQLVLRDVVGDVDAIEQRLRAIAREGVPNYFGEQRFGRFGNNVAQALAMFRGSRVRREQRAMLLSAARSELFNRVLSTRVSDGSWNRALDGEVLMLDGSRSVFGPEPWTDALATRLAAFDIHPTGPLWGRGTLRSAEAALALEHTVLSDPESLAIREGLEAAGLDQERRSTRLRPATLAWSWPEPGILRLEFPLPPGTYATTLLAELGSLGDRSSETEDRH